MRGEVDAPVLGIILLMFSIIVILSVVVPALLEGIQTGLYQKCLGNTLNDIDEFKNRLQQISSGKSDSKGLRVRACTEEIVFTNKDWKQNLKAGTTVECDSNADAHVIVYKRDYNVWKSIRAIKKDTKETILTKIAPKTFCKNIYGFSFDTIPKSIVGPKKDVEEVYCLTFTVNNEQKYVSVYDVKVVATKDVCVA